VSPATPIAAVAEFVDDLRIIMVMTVEPGFGGQHFMAEPAPKIAEARRMFGDRAGTEVHVDGGVNAETAGIVGGLRRGRVRRRIGPLPTRTRHGR